ncbi:hypothetical protein C5Y96_01635 [Blastopirellula marina]|uniref:Uncharacterized protein n=1 Tax=Blastopirellula marina TaxID=124 RepID=A0A2S8G7N0_9BACT|nr:MULTISPECIES: hypothetical protein [Pirellulaceae]PQO40300.1 hypothetical protein C5Y96_01635 [Blastopirellula marina]RCS55848.1 hypothetical protein DTL36_01635 [Bremerella cremea]
MSKSKSPPATTPDSEVASPATRSFISLALFAYLFGLWVVVSSSLGGGYSSLLHEKLLNLFQLYTEPLNLEVRASPYSLYSGTPADYEHFFRVEVSTPSGETETYEVPGPMLGSGPRDPYRYQRLAKIVGLQAEISDDTLPAEITKGIGQYFLRQTGSSKVSIRCIRRRPQPMELTIDGQVFAADPKDPSYETELYRATVLVDPEGSFQLIKEMATEHVAPVE